MRTSCESTDDPVDVENGTGHVHVIYPRWKDVGPIQLTPEQARMLARVLRGSADEIDRRIR